MLALGLAGGLDAVDEQNLDTPDNYTYDGAAVLVENGAVVAAFEQERLDRIKHSNKFPLQAIEACLAMRGVTARDLDAIGYYVDERTADALLARLFLARPDIGMRVNARTLLQATLGRGLQCAIDPSKLRFYEHRMTHAASAMHQSGFDDALVYVVDNAGGVYRGTRAEDGRVAIEPLLLISPAQSLQRLCQAVFPFLGLGIFDEHKGIALASRGDADRFAPLVDAMVELLPDGQYRLHLDRAGALMGVVDPPRGKEPGQEHEDLAAAVQRAMERVVLHVAGHFRHATGIARICLAGGMAENTSTNGRILDARLFDDVFVHPAAYDSGCAVGAALLASQDAGVPSVRQRVQSVRWGGEPRAALVEEWNGLLRAERSEHAPLAAARLLAGNRLVGWVDGRSDFGSHALGSRNVLADPRPVENRVRVHTALHRAETYRPLAALVPEEELHAWCDLPKTVTALPFQTFAVRVRAERRAELGAAMQDDGCARVQSVSRETEPRLHALLRAFGESTGTAALLSASFNTKIEPVVETADDAIVSFLNSGLDALVIGDWVAEKVEARWSEDVPLRASLPPYVRIVRAKGLAERKRRASSDEIRTTFTPGLRRTISRELADALIALDGEEPLSEVVGRGAADADGRRRLMDELLALWALRMIVLRPATAREATT